MSDWLDELTPDERSTWDEFVEAFRRDALRKIAGSAAFLSLVPNDNAVDVKFCAELGTAVMLDKPIIAVVMPGRAIPAKLRLLADHVIEADVDVEGGREKLAAAIEAVLP